MDLVNQFLELAKAHAWLPLISLALGGIVRMSKSDAIGPVVPSKYRPWLAWSLGALTFVVDSLMGGAPVSAIIYGFGAPLLAIVGHKLGIEKLRDGEEIPLPKLLTRKDAADVGRKSTLAIVLLVALVPFVGGCRSFMHFQDPTADDFVERLCAGKAQDAEAAILAESQRTGVSPDQLRLAFKTACLFRASRGLNEAASAGMEGVGQTSARLGNRPLTPENAAPLKPVPELEQRK